MKLEPFFTVKDNNLIRIADNQTVDISNLPVISSDKLVFNANPFFIITLPWSKIEIESELYNEEYLAQLRNFLKQFEEKKQYVIIKPIIDKTFETEEQIENFITTFNHTARRLKDCISLIGMELSENILAKGLSQTSPAANFMETLAIKHAQFIYIANRKIIKEDSNNIQLLSSIALY